MNFKLSIGGQDAHPTELIKIIIINHIFLDDMYSLIDNIKT